MTNKEIETLDEVLEKENQQQGKKKKGIIVAIIAVFAAIAVVASTIAISLSRKKGGNTGSSNNTTSTTSSYSLDDMGNELEIPSTTTQKFGEVVQGTVKLEEVVEQDGKLYANESEASEAKNKKTTSINLKNDTLKTSNGKVYDKTTGYIIEDETGKTVATGNLNENGIPDGYAYDSVLNKIVPKDEIGKYVYADATYYDVEGTAIIYKGDIVSKETLEKAKKYLSISKVSTTVKNDSTTVTTTRNNTTTTTKNNTTTAKNNTTTTTTTVKPTTTTTSDKGVVNEDGTYTIFGLTFESKDDYQQWVLQGYEGYAEVDGIMKSEKEIQKQLVK